jgi:hypothetical protein
MHKRTKVAIFALVALLAAILAASLVNVYLLREDSDGELLWSPNEAYLFLGVAHRGAHMDYLEYPWMIFRESVGGVSAPNSERQSVTVIHITPSGLEKHVIEVAAAPPGSWPGMYTPFKGQIYANYPEIGGLSRWAGDHFEAATAEEQQRFGGFSRLSAVDFTNVDGWSKHGIGGGPQDLFARSTIDVSGRFTISEKSEPVGHTGYAAVSIYLQRPSALPERIWYLDGHPRRVSRAEYEHAFARH